MKERDYKAVIKLIRKITYDLIDLSNEFRLNDDDIGRPMRKLQLLEDYITADYVEGEDECGQSS